MIRIHLPWPPLELNPNKRIHWATKARATKSYRHTCWVLAKSAIGNQPIELKRVDGRIEVSIQFYPPDHRHRDDDNMIGAFKSGRDGIAQALNVNDKLFLPNYQFPLNPKSGEIVFEVQTNG